MPVTLEALKQELARLTDIREKTWAEYNQIMGAANQLEKIIQAWESEAHEAEKHG